MVILPFKITDYWCISTNEISRYLVSVIPDTLQQCSIIGSVLALQEPVFASSSWHAFMEFETVTRRILAV